ncbi:hypothetical protein ACH3XW_12535 [Acanthocheilonema viteae]
MTTIIGFRQLLTDFGNFLTFIGDEFGCCMASRMLGPRCDEQNRRKSDLRCFLRISMKCREKIEHIRRSVDVLKL